MSKRIQHMILVFLLLFCTTAHLWAGDGSDQQDSVELNEKSAEDSELYEKESESEEKRKQYSVHGTNPVLFRVAGKLQSSCLVCFKQLSAASGLADRRLYILLVRLKLHL